MGKEMELVTYCGLYCDLCSARARIPQRAMALYEAMEVEGWPYWGRSFPGFKEFWAFLDDLRTGPGCPGCRAEGGPPQCKIRSCAREREKELCSNCPDFPCTHIQSLGNRYPNLIADNRRLQLVGMEQWLVEQRERVHRGVVYTDIRYRIDE